MKERASIVAMRTAAPACVHAPGMASGSNCEPARPATSSNEKSRTLVTSPSSCSRRAPGPQRRGRAGQREHEVRHDPPAMGGRTLILRVQGQKDAVPVTQYARRSQPSQREIWRPARTMKRQATAAATIPGRSDGCAEGPRRPPRPRRPQTAPAPRRLSGRLVDRSPGTGPPPRRNRTRGGPRRLDLGPRCPTGLRDPCAPFPAPARARSAPDPARRPAPDRGRGSRHRRRCSRAGRRSRRRRGSAWRWRRRPG